jgi:hypothetical protein
MRLELATAIRAVVTWANVEARSVSLAVGPADAFAQRYISSACGGDRHNTAKIARHMIRNADLRQHGSNRPAFEGGSRSAATATERTPATDASRTQRRYLSTFSRSPSASRLRSPPSMQSPVTIGSCFSIGEDHVRRTTPEQLHR